MGHGGRCRANAHDGVRIQLREKNSKKGGISRVTHRLETKDEERGSRDRWMHGCGEIRRDARKDEGEARSRVKSGLETSFPRREILSLTISKSNGIIINSGREQRERERKEEGSNRIISFFFLFHEKEG